MAKDLRWHNREVLNDQLNRMFFQALVEMTKVGYVGVNKQKKEAYDMFTARLKNFEADQNNLDELVELAAWAKSLVAAYTDNTIPVPDWLTESSTAIGTEIKRRNQDYLAKQLKETEAALATLKTKEEKKTELLAQAEKLKQALGR